MGEVGSRPTMPVACSAFQISATASSRRTMVLAATHASAEMVKLTASRGMSAVRLARSGKQRSRTKSAAKTPATLSARVVTLSRRFFLRRRQA